MNLVKWSAVSLSTILVLSACQGQNPFKRDSNPIRNYPRVADSIQKQDGALPYGSKPATTAASPEHCSAPFEIRSNSSDGHSLFSFVEDSSQAYELIIKNRLNDVFEVEFKNLPTGMETPKLMSTPTVGSAVYQMNWTPKNLIPASESTFRPVISMTLKSKALAERCKTAAATETLNILVEKVEGRPRVALNLPELIDFGGSQKFTIEVTDPAATPGKEPVLNAFTFTAPAAEEGALQALDASKSISECDSTTKPKFTDGKWQFSCTFLSGGLGANDQGLVNSGKIARAVFAISVTSPASGKSSHVVEGSIKVKFKKVPTPKAASQGPKK